MPRGEVIIIIVIKYVNISIVAIIRLIINMNTFRILIIEPRRAYKAYLTSEGMGGERIRGTGVTTKTLAKVLMVMVMHMVTMVNLYLKL